MRKTMFWSSLIATALFGSACKKDAAEKADEDLRKSVEEVREQREDVREQRKDVAEEQRDVTKEQQDLAKQERELSQAQGDLAIARNNYVTMMRERLARLDGKIRQLEMRTDAKAKESARELRILRDNAASRLDTAASRTEAEWNEFKTDLGKSFDDLERRIDDHLDDDDERAVPGPAGTYR